MPTPQLVSAASSSAPHLAIVTRTAGWHTHLQELWILAPHGCAPYTNPSAVVGRCLHRSPHCCQRFSLLRQLGHQLPLQLRTLLLLLLAMRRAWGLHHLPGAD
jgi:hypothetical protein